MTVITKPRLAQSRANERRRQAEHRARMEPVIAPGQVRVLRTRSEAEVIDMVEESGKSWQALGGRRCGSHAELSIAWPAPASRVKRIIASAESQAGR